MSLTRRHTFTRSELDSFVHEVWDIRLEPWQLDDYLRFILGGVFAYSIPTGFGKSMGLEIVHCCRLVDDPNRRQIAIKSNDTTANEMTVEVCRRLQDISVRCIQRGGPMFDWVTPNVRWTGRQRGEEIDPWRHTPFAVKDGFTVAGIDLRHRHRSIQSFRGYGIGDQDLQGKGGDTSIDDVERLEHADSEAERRRLATRMDGVVRTLDENPHDTLWIMVGTAMHEESVYDKVCEQLGGLTIPWARVERPLYNADGSLLSSRLAEKIMVHKALMSKRAWNVGYELKRDRRRAMSTVEIEQTLRDAAMPWITNEREFAAYFLDWALRNAPPYTSPQTWRLRVEESIQRELKFYICWDPATENDWAVVVVAMWGDHMWLLRCVVDDLDTWEQLQQVKDCYLHFPSAMLVLETNGQQKVFLDVAREDDVLSQIKYHRHTSQGRKHPQAGVPAMMEFIREGFLRCPWGDPARAGLEFERFEHEVTHFGPTAHPHALMAIWFAWRLHRRSRIGNSMRARIARQAAKAETTQNVIQIPRPAPNLLGSTPRQGTWLRDRSRSAWSRRHR